jgi:hypothetical protein
MTGAQLATFCEELNGGASIGETLLFQLINVSRALIEQRRPWMVLRYTDSSKTVTTSNTWQSAISLSTITRFNRFYGEYPVKLFDSSNRIEYFRQVPFNQRLHYKDATNTFVYDEANKNLYLNGTVFAGTLWIDYLKDSADLANDANEWAFPSWSHPILGHMAVGMHKAGIDYDEVNARQAAFNGADAQRTLQMLEAWDDEKQRAAISQADPTFPPTDGFRPSAINI